MHRVCLLCCHARSISTTRCPSADPSRQFLAQGYAVVFLHREKSAQPFAATMSASDVLAMLAVGPDGSVSGESVLHTNTHTHTHTHTHTYTVLSLFLSLSLSFTFLLFFFSKTSQPTSILVISCEMRFAKSRKYDTCFQVVTYIKKTIYLLMRSGQKRGNAFNSLLCIGFRLSTPAPRLH